MTTDILGEYDRSLGTRRDFCDRMRMLITQLMARRSIVPHEVSSRLKTRESLSEKLSRPGKSYRSINDITDICGVRIVTYFEDEVPKVAELIKHEFAVDSRNSLDKSETLAADQFGYRSVHFIVSINAPRSGLEEYAAFQGMACEIQVRSILQHAWAQIEHKLGYKSESSVPTVVRRRFARLAGLLELGDQEFVQIRETTSEYARTVRDNLAQSKRDVLLDVVSIAQFVNEGDLVDQLDQEISAAAGVPVSTDDPFWESDLRQLNAAGITTVGELRSALERYARYLPYLAKVWLTAGEHDSLGKGISIFYTIYFVVAESGDAHKMARYLEAANIGFRESNIDAANDILRHVAAAKNVANDKRT